MPEALPTPSQIHAKPGHHLSEWCGAVEVLLCRFDHFSRLKVLSTKSLLYVLSSGLPCTSASATLSCNPIIEARRFKLYQFIRGEISTSATRAVGFSLCYDVTFYEPSALRLSPNYLFVVRNPRSALPVAASIWASVCSCLPPLILKPSRINLHEYRKLPYRQRRNNKALVRGWMKLVFSPKPLKQLRSVFRVQPVIAMLRCTFCND